MARPIEIDRDQLEKLAAIHCTNTEIAAVMDCDSSLLSKPPYSEIIAKGKEKGKMSLRRAMYNSAVTKGNIAMQIWLSKQLLGMREPTAFSDALNTGGITINLAYDPKAPKPEINVKDINTESQ